MNACDDSATELVEVHPAPLSLRDWCLCAVVRRVGPAPVRATVQASTWASLNVVVEGEVHGARGALPHRFVTAPFPVPFDTVTCGPMQSITLVMQPWAMHALAGSPAGSLGVEPVDGASLAARSLDELFDTMQRACVVGDLHALWSALAERSTRVEAVRPELACGELLAGGVEAAARALGCSPRQYLRRFRNAMGLAPSTWMRVGRWESVLRDLAGGAEAPMAQLALQHGFCDQAHLARDTRSLSKAAPARLRQLLHVGGMPWSLRPANV